MTNRKRARSPTPSLEDSQDAFSFVVIKNEHPQSMEEPIDIAEGPSKKPRVVARLTPEEETEMVDFIRDHPCLYNRKLRAWTERPLKDKLWLDQAEKLHRTVVEIKTWYESIRTRLGRLKRIKSGQSDVELSERDQWIYDSFMFLCPHIIEVQRRSTASLKSKMAATSGATAESQPSTSTTDDAQLYQDEEISMPRTASIVNAVPSPSLITASATGNYGSGGQDTAQLLERQERLMNISETIISTFMPTTDRERTTFCHWITSVLHELPRDLYRAAQRDIWNMLEGYRQQQDSREAVNQQSVVNHFNLPQSE